MAVRFNYDFTFEGTTYRIACEVDYYLNHGIVWPSKTDPGDDPNPVVTEVCVYSVTPDAATDRVADAFIRGFSVDNPRFRERVMEDCLIGLDGSNGED